jgi:hypothetical protein
MKLNLLNSSLLDIGSQTPIEGKEVFYFIMNRKAFNFYRSYYDVGCELSDKDRLAFYDAIMTLQFKGEYTPLKGVSKFAFLSQKHSIDAQIKGYYDKTKDPMFAPCQGGIQGGWQQEEEKGQEKGQVQGQLQVNIPFEIFWNLYDKKIEKDKCESKWNKLTDKERENIINYLPKYKLSTPDKQYRKNPETFFNNKTWNDEIITPHSQTHTQTSFNLPQNKKL